MGQQYAGQQAITSAGAAVEHELRHDLAWRIAVPALAAGAAAGVAVTLFPRLDIAVAQLFFTANGAFIGREIAAIAWLRNGFIALFAASAFIAAAGVLLTCRRGTVWGGLNFAGWLFLAVCLAAGPGIVANTVLKDHWGRARPHQIVEFGGTKTFTPALEPAQQCERNCSFVSGEASSMFMLFFAFAFLNPRRARQLVAAGAVAGASAGLVRMAQGGHFFSDVLFAGVLMALTAAALHGAFTVLARPRQQAAVTGVDEALA